MSLVVVPVPPDESVVFRELDPGSSYVGKATWPTGKLRILVVARRDGWAWVDRVSGLLGLVKTFDPRDACRESVARVRAVHAGAGGGPR